MESSGGPARKYYHLTDKGDAYRKSQKEEWNFDALSKHIPFFAQVWYDTHGRDENYIYKVDEKGNLSVEKDVSETED